MGNLLTLRPNADGLSGSFERVARYEGANEKEKRDFLVRIGTLQIGNKRKKVCVESGQLPGERSRGAREGGF